MTTVNLKEVDVSASCVDRSLWCKQCYFGNSGVCLKPAKLSCDPEERDDGKAIYFEKAE